MEEYIKDSKGEYRLNLYGEKIPIIAKDPKDQEFNNLLRSFPDTDYNTIQMIYSGNNNENDSRMLLKEMGCVEVHTNGSGNKNDTIFGDNNYGNSTFPQNDIFNGNLNVAPVNTKIDNYHGYPGLNGLKNNSFGQPYSNNTKPIDTMYTNNYKNDVGNATHNTNNQNFNNNAQFDKDKFKKRINSAASTRNILSISTAPRPTGNVDTLMNLNTGYGNNSIHSGQPSHQINYYQNDNSLPNNIQQPSSTNFENQAHNNGISQPNSNSNFSVNENKSSSNHQYGNNFASFENPADIHMFDDPLRNTNNTEKSIDSNLTSHMATNQHLFDNNISTTKNLSPNLDNSTKLNSSNVNTNNAIDSNTTTFDPILNSTTTNNDPKYEPPYQVSTKFCVYSTYGNKNYQLILLRGVPGTGKTTEAEKIKEKFENLDFKVTSVSFDAYYTNDKGKYKFKKESLKDGEDNIKELTHDAVQSNPVDSLEEKKGHVVVLDAENLNKLEYYAKLATDNQYQLVFIYPNVDWTNNPEICTEKTKHRRHRRIADLITVFNKNLYTPDQLIVQAGINTNNLTKLNVKTEEEHLVEEEKRKQLLIQKQIEESNRKRREQELKLRQEQELKLRQKQELKLRQEQEQKLLQEQQNEESSDRTESDEETSFCSVQEDIPNQNKQFKIEDDNKENISTDYEQVNKQKTNEKLTILSDSKLPTINKNSSKISDSPTTKITSQVKETKSYKKQESVIKPEKDENFNMIKIVATTEQMKQIIKPFRNELDKMNSLLPNADIVKLDSIEEYVDNEFIIQIPEVYIRQNIFKWFVKSAKLQKDKNNETRELISAWMRPQQETEVPNLDNNSTDLINLANFEIETSSQSETKDSLLNDLSSSINSTKSRDKKNKRKIPKLDNNLNDLMNLTKNEIPEISERNLKILNDFNAALNSTKSEDESNDTMSVKSTNSSKESSADLVCKSSLNFRTAKSKFE